MRCDGIRVKWISRLPHRKIRAASNSFEKGHLHEFHRPAGQRNTTASRFTNPLTRRRTILFRTSGSYSVYTSTSNGNRIGGFICVLLRAGRVAGAVGCVGGCSWLRNPRSTRVWNWMPTGASWVGGATSGRLPAIVRWTVLEELGMIHNSSFGEMSIPCVAPDGSTAGGTFRWNRKSGCDCSRGRSHRHSGASRRRRRAACRTRPDLCRACPNLSATDTVVRL